VSGAFLTLTYSPSASSSRSSSFSWIIFGATVLSCARVVLVARQIRQTTTLDIVNSSIASSDWSPAPPYFVSLSYHSFRVFFPLFLLFRFLSLFSSYFSSPFSLEASFSTLPPLLPSVSPSSYIFLLISLLFFTSLSLLFSFRLLLQISPVTYSLLSLLLNLLWLFFFAKEESSSFSSSSISPLTFTGFSLLYAGLLLYFYIHFPSSASPSSSCVSCSSSSAFSSSRGHPSSSLFLPLLLPLLLFVLAGLLLYASPLSPCQSSSSSSSSTFVMFPPEVEMSQTQVHGDKCIQSLRFKLFEVFRPLILKNKPGNSCSSCSTSLLLLLSLLLLPLFFSVHFCLTLTPLSLRSLLFSPFSPLWTLNFSSPLTTPPLL
jgi:hypothetical protein